MNAPARKRRRHPLTLLVVLLGISLAASLLILAFAEQALHQIDRKLDSAYSAGMAQGYALCRAAQEGGQ